MRRHFFNSRISIPSSISSNIQRQPTTNEGNIQEGKTEATQSSICSSNNGKTQAPLSKNSQAKTTRAISDQSRKSSSSSTQNFKTKAQTDPSSATTPGKFGSTPITGGIPAGISVRHVVSSCIDEECIFIAVVGPQFLWRLSEKLERWRLVVGP